MIRLTIFLICCVSLFAQTAGTIQTVAGKGSQTFGGDDGPAIQAALNVPVDVFVDQAGNIFIAGQFNSRIRKVGSNGAISTVVGNGVAGFSGDGGPVISAEINTPTSNFVKIQVQ
jgi:trimeric autotransporter adhesin